MKQNCQMDFCRYKVSYSWIP